MIQWKALLAVVAAVVLCTACHNKRATRTVTSRAAFELSCPEEDLHLTVLAADGPRQLAKQIGVEGCGQKMVYVYFSSTDTWIANTAVTPAMLQKETDFNEQQAREDQALEDQRRLEQQRTYQRGTSE